MYLLHILYQLTILLPALPRNDYRINIDKLKAYFDCYVTIGIPIWVLKIKLHNKKLMIEIKWTLFAVVITQTKIKEYSLYTYSLWINLFYKSLQRWHPWWRKMTVLKEDPLATIHCTFHHGLRPGPLPLSERYSAQFALELHFFGKFVQVSSRISTLLIVIG